MLSGPETARLLDQFEEAYLTAEDPDNSLNPKNHEMGQATQKTFQQQVNNLCDVIKCMGNPFLDDFPELVTLHSRDCVDPEVAESFRGLESTGNVQYQAFIKDVVTACTKPIHDTIKKNNLSLFKRSWLYSHNCMSQCRVEMEIWMSFSLTKSRPFHPPSLSLGIYIFLVQSQSYLCALLRRSTRSHQ